MRVGRRKERENNQSLGVKERNNSVEVRKKEGEREQSGLRV